MILEEFYTDLPRPPDESAFSHYGSLGGWLGLAAPVLAWAAAALVWNVGAGFPLSAGSAGLTVLLAFGLTYPPGYLLGWIVGGVSRWVRRRRRSDRRDGWQEFVGGFAAGTAAWGAGTIALLIAASVA